MKRNIESFKHWMQLLKPLVDSSSSETSFATSSLASGLSGEESLPSSLVIETKVPERKGVTARF